jgi:hypothetical protein
LPASLTVPHSRQLLLSSVGAMALVAQLWAFHFKERQGTGTARRRISRSVTLFVLFVHLVFSPLALPFTSASIALAAPAHRAADALGPEIGGRDVVFVTLPDFWVARLAQLRKRIEHQPLARRWRTLSAGPERLTVHRSDARTLVADYAGGMLQGPLSTLYRDRRLRMNVGERMHLDGLTIEILATTADGRAQRVAFTFDQALDSAELVFYYWQHNQLTRLVLPPVGKAVTLPIATMDL